MFKTLKEIVKNFLYLVTEGEHKNSLVMVLKPYPVKDKETDSIKMVEGKPLIGWGTGSAYKDAILRQGLPYKFKGSVFYADPNFVLKGSDGKAIDMDDLLK